MEESVSGIKALLTLATTLLESTDVENPNSIITQIAQANGVLTYLQNEIIGVTRDNPTFEKALLEGSEMATVFASHFDLTMPGVIWISLHEESPEEDGKSILPGRERAFMVDLNGDGERVNITTIIFELPELTSQLVYLGLWESETGDDLIEAGQLAKPLPLAGRTSLSLGPGGLRVKTT